MRRLNLVLLFSLIFYSTPINPTQPTQLAVDPNLIDPNVILHDIIQTTEIPIRFWRGDPNYFQIIDSKIFPLFDFGGYNVIRGLGKAWITWTVQTGDHKIALVALYNKGNIDVFKVYDDYEYTEVYFKGLGPRLFLITSTVNVTNFRIISPTISDYSVNYQYASENHQIWVYQTGFKLFLIENGIGRKYIINNGTHAEEF